MWELDHKEGWTLKNWCFWSAVLKKTLESPLDCKEIQPVNPKGNQLWIFIGRTDAEAEALILWPPDAKSQLIGKDPDAGKDWGQEEKGTTEYEMVGWHHWCDGPEFEEAPGVGDGQGSLSAAAHGVTNSRTQLSDFIFTFRVVEIKSVYKNQLLFLNISNKNSGVREDSWESLGLQGDPTNPRLRKSVLNIHWKDWCWSWRCNTLATWREELTA